MIVLDSSAILAIYLREPGHLELLEKIWSETECLVGSPTQFESALVLSNRGVSDAWRTVNSLLSSFGATVVNFAPEHAEAAYDAYQMFGKGRHPAKLNMGDCIAYAVARKANAPLLFVGEDFPLTDIEPALSTK